MFTPEKFEAILTGDDDTPQWVLPDFVCQGTMVCLVGDAGVGKSSFCYYLSLLLAHPEPQTFLGKPVTRAKVLYFDEENSLPDLQTYLRWSWRGLGKPDWKEIYQYLHVAHFDLRDNRMEFMMAVARDVHPALIVIDTATPICSIRDENDNGQASEAIRGLRHVRHAGGDHTAMLILKHAKLDHESGEVTIRGAKAWKGETDATLFHTAAPGRPPERPKLRTTMISPGKVRAHGLTRSIVVKPDWIKVEYSQRWVLRYKREDE